MMKNTKQQRHEELELEMLRARKWMSNPIRTNEEREKWYPKYKKLVDEITQIEKEMWGPVPW